MKTTKNPLPPKTLICGCTETGLLCFEHARETKKASGPVCACGAVATTYLDLGRGIVGCAACFAKGRKS